MGVTTPALHLRAPSFPPAGERDARGARAWKRKGPAASYSRTGESRTTLGDGALDFRVRNGNGYFLPAMATGIIRAASEAENFVSGKYPSRLQSLGGTLSAERNKMIFEGTIWPSLTTY